MKNTFYPQNRQPFRRMDRCARSSDRRGAVMIAVLVCLGVAMSLLTVMASRMMLTHRQIRRQAVNNQAQLLCQAGIDRAKKNLQDDSSKDSYNGETWRIPADELGDRGAAEVTIAVERGMTATITARFPLDDQMETKFQRTITIDGE